MNEGSTTGASSALSILDDYSHPSSSVLLSESGRIAEQEELLKKV